MIRFILNSEEHAAENVSPTTTMLDYVRSHLSLTGTKEGCAEGDCGACTVVRVTDGRFEAVNACLMQIGQADGTEIITVEGLEALNLERNAVEEWSAAHAGAHPSTYAQKKEVTRCSRRTELLISHHYY